MKKKLNYDVKKRIKRDKKIDDMISMLHMNCNPNLNDGWLLFDENVGILKTGIQNAVIIFTPYAYRWDIHEHLHTVFKNSTHVLLALA